MDEKQYFEYLTARNKLSILVRRYFIKDLVRHFQGNVLDVGCGIGEFLAHYQYSIGVDINHYVVDYCRKEGFSCSISESNKLPFQSNCFDGVLASNILEHLESAEQTAKDIYRILKPGGVFVITVPMKAGFRHDPTHRQMFTKIDLKNLANEHGFSVKETYLFPFPWNWLGNYLYFCELRAVLIKE
jgi:SAM-dependent methyltransferase